jgi:RimJ/RimL family protein N-acetyltransferase
VANVEQTARLVYEPLAASHAAELRGALIDPRLYAYITKPCPHTVLDLKAEFVRVAAGPPKDHEGEAWWNFAVRLRDGEYIGRIQATFHDGLAEVAYMFGVSYWGQGYATEALLWLRDRVAETQKANSLWATVNPENSRSIRLLERLGYQRMSQEWPPLFSYEPEDLVYCQQIFSSPT